MILFSHLPSVGKLQAPCFMAGWLIFGQCRYWTWTDFQWKRKSENGTKLIFHSIRIQRISFLPLTGRIESRVQCLGCIYLLLLFEIHIKLRILLLSTPALFSVFVSKSNQKNIYQTTEFTEKKERKKHLNSKHWLDTLHVNYIIL